MRKPILLAALLTALAYVSPAEAQFGRLQRRQVSVNTATRGQGRLEIGRDTTRSLDRASVILRRGGAAEVHLYRGNTPYVFTGQWTGNPGRVADLQFTQRDGVPIRASGRAVLQGGDDLRQVEIHGDERGQRLYVAFNADGAGTVGSAGSVGSASGAPVYSEVTRNTKGEGQLELGNDTRRALSRANLVLRRGGYAEARFYRGNTPYVFTGQWNEVRPGVVQLQLTERDKVPVRAAGTAYLRQNGELDRVQISGREQRERLQVSFAAEGSRDGRGAFDYINEADKYRNR
jgi:hypothetical protein